MVILQITIQLQHVMGTFGICHGQICKFHGHFLSKLPLAISNFTGRFVRQITLGNLKISRGILVFSCFKENAAHTVLSFYYSFYFMIKISYPDFYICEQ